MQHAVKSKGSEQEFVSTVPETVEGNSPTDRQPLCSKNKISPIFSNLRFSLSASVIKERGVKFQTFNPSVANPQNTPCDKPPLLGEKPRQGKRGKSSAKRINSSETDLFSPSSAPRAQQLLGIVCVDQSTFHHKSPDHSAIYSSEKQKPLAPPCPCKSKGNPEHRRKAGGASEFLPKNMAPKTSKAIECGKTHDRLRTFSNGFFRATNNG